MKRYVIYILIFTFLIFSCSVSTPGDFSNDKTSDNPATETHEPQESETPENPDSSQTAEMPENPETPDSSDDPEVPNTPDNPDNPENPEVQDDEPMEVFTPTKSPYIPAKLSPKSTSDLARNSAEITKSGTELDIGDAKNFYTITINYPSSDYSGVANQTDFSIKGSGSTKALYNSQISFRLKSVPSGTEDWVDLLDQRRYKTTGHYWFTDNVNGIKYYRTDSAIEQVCKPFYDDMEKDYWQPMKNRLLSGIFSDNIFGGEQASFGLKGYDKGKNGYFNVIFDDFFPGSIVEAGESVSGLAGQYQSPHIRPGQMTQLSNEADIFYVNSRYYESRFKRNISTPYECADNITSTLVHEYMHYLMDSHHLLEAEKEYSNSLDPKTGTIMGEYGVLFPSDPDYKGKNYSSILRGSLFWLEGCANYAPYRMLGMTNQNATLSWLEIMDSWRPDLSNSYTQYTNAGSTFAVYGAGALFMSYIAEKYGTDVSNSIHQYRDTGAQIEEYYNLYGSAYLDYVGNLNVIFKKILNKEFKDVYLEFLMQAMSSLSSECHIEGSCDYMKCFEDWGFVKSVVDNAIYKHGDFVITDAHEGFEKTGLPELSFVINRWDEVPQVLSLEGENVKCYAVWF